MFWVSGGLRAPLQVASSDKGSPQCRRSRASVDDQAPGRTLPETGRRELQYGSCLLLVERRPAGVLGSINTHLCMATLHAAR